MILSVLSALAEPTRFAAIRLLADGDEHCVCELMQALGATQSRMSRHMQVLRQAGLVIDRRDAQWVRYRINRICRQASQLFSKRFAKLKLNRKGAWHDHGDTRCGPSS